MKKYKTVLTIAGSDSGGGAGIQADLKTFSALGCYGMTVITALTAQNTQGVQAICNIDKSFVQQQLDSIFSDIVCDAVKIGMLHNEGVINVVAKILEKYKPKNIVLDPVFIANDNSQLIEPQAIDTLKKSLFKTVDLITPNIPEAETLLGARIENDEMMMEAAKKIATLYHVNVLLKGGHLASNNSPDILFLSNSRKAYHFTMPRIITDNTHGTGCTLSSAIASYLAQGHDLYASVVLAKKYIHQSIQQGAEYQLGKGYAPVHHFFQQWSHHDK